MCALVIFPTASSAAENKVVSLSVSNSQAEARVVRAGRDLLQFSSNTNNIE